MYLGYREDGDTCPEKDCTGTMYFPAPEGCSCHINPPCHSCTSVLLTCRECGYEDEPEPCKDVPVATGLSIRGYKPKPLDSTKIDYRVKMHSGSSQICEGVYPEGTTQAQVREVVDGTFGGKFSSFGGGKFKFIAYTD